MPRNPNPLSQVTARQLDVLCVSQFTLHARVKKPKPDFSKAMGPGPARELYSKFLERLRTDYHPDRVHDGVFGAMMDVVGARARASGGGGERRGEGAFGLGASCGGCPRDGALIGRIARMPRSRCDACQRVR